MSDTKLLRRIQVMISPEAGAALDSMVRDNRETITRAVEESILDRYQRQPQEPIAERSRGAVERDACLVCDKPISPGTASKKSSVIHAACDTDIQTDGRSVSKPKRVRHNLAADGSIISRRGKGVIDPELDMALPLPKVDLIPVLAESNRTTYCPRHRPKHCELSCPHRVSV